jgi:hypothetical protein
LRCLPAVDRTAVLRSTCNVTGLAKLLFCGCVWIVLAESV